MVIRLGRGAHYHLGALSRRDKLGRVAVFHKVLPVFGNARFDEPHGLKDAVPRLVRGEGGKRLLRRELDIYAHSVREKTKPVC